MRNNRVLLITDEFGSGGAEHQLLYPVIGLKNAGFLVVFTGMAVLSTMAYGMLHNTSFLSGEVIVFILLAIMLKVDKLRDIGNIPI